MPCAPVLDEFLKKDNRGRPLKVRLKNTARVRVTHHNQDPTIRGDTNILDEFSSKTGGRGAPPDRDKTANPGACATTPDMVFLIKQMKDTEFPSLGKTGSEADHNSFPWRGPEGLSKWTDIVKGKST